jgi:hypothetical protein
MSEVRHIDWEEVGEAYWQAFRDAYYWRGKAKVNPQPEWKQLSNHYRASIIAGCKAAYELAVEES